MDNDFLILIMMIAVYFLPYFLIFKLIKLSTGALGKIQGALDGIQNKGKSSGMFGLKDRAKIAKENSPWALARSANRQQRTKEYQRKFASTLDANNLRGKTLRKYAGGGDARSIVLNAKAQQIKELQDEIERSVGGDFYKLNELVNGTTTSSNPLHSLKDNEFARAAAFNLSAKMGKANSSEFSNIGKVFSEDSDLRNKIIGDNAFASKQAGNFAMGEIESVDGAGVIKWKGQPIGSGDVRSSTRSAVENINPEQLKFLGTETPPGSAMPRFKDKNVQDLFRTPEGSAIAREWLDDLSIQQSMSPAQKKIFESIATPAPPPPPTPKVSVPPTATAVTMDKSYYTTHPNPYIPDPSDPTKSIPNPAAEWKPTNNQ